MPAKGERDGGLRGELLVPVAADAATRSGGNVRRTTRHAGTNVTTARTLFLRYACKRTLRSCTVSKQEKEGLAQSFLKDNQRQ